MEIDQEAQDIWAEVSVGREGYISSDLKDAALEGIRVALKRAHMMEELRDDLDHRAWHIRELLKKATMSERNDPLDGPVIEIAIEEVDEARELFDRLEAL